jgi:beta-glucosidase
MIKAVTTEQPVYLDTSRPFAERVKDLVGRMTLEEKVGLMNHPAHGIPRLNIPAYNYWSEALHGVARNGRATVFPQAIAMAATWDKKLIQQVASAISDEGRAKYHEALRRNGYTDQLCTKGTISIPCHMGLLTSSFRCIVF